LGTIEIYGWYQTDLKSSNNRENGAGKTFHAKIRGTSTILYFILYQQKNAIQKSFNKILKFNLIDVECLALL